MNVHDIWASRNLDALRRVLGPSRRHGGGGGLGAGSAVGSPPAYAGFGGGASITAAEVNRRDLKGRTLLHVLAACEEEGRAMEWVRALAGHPGLQINASDAESGWTALHRALYNGNLGMARCLVDELGCDIHIKDHEGLTAMDLWNASVEGTNPADRVGPDPARAELFTWGNNRNFVLGTASDGDRALPERVPLAGLSRPKTGPTAFRPANVSHVAMARLHTAVVTAEGDLRTCGFGSGGRLGLGPTQTQFALAEVTGIQQKVRQVALGQDHTVVVTEKGDVYTFGMNRFGQLGHPPDPGQPTGKTEKEDIQATPKRVVNVLKKEVVLGAAASRWHTAVFTSDTIFTWGANHGQLGYSGQQIQYTPRRVTASLLTSPVRELVATEQATIVLLQTLELVILYADSVTRLAYPADRFPSAMQVYRPPQVSGRSQVVKVSASGDTLAAVTSLGDVFAWTFDSPEQGAAPPKAQRIWSLRKKFTAVTDAAVGMDGSIILSTRSGHCFLRSRRLETATGTRGVELRAPVQAPSGKKAFKFYRVPFLQRVIQVAANPTGAFAAVRSDARLDSIEIVGDSLAESLAGILPHLRRYGGLLPILLDVDANSNGEDEDATGQYDGGSLDKDVRVASALISIHTVWDDTWTAEAAGSDVVIVSREHRVPAHRVVLAARSSVFADAFGRKGASAPDWLDADGGEIHLEGCSHFAVLLLLHYLYTDDLPAVWDPRVGTSVRDLHPDFDLDIAKTKSELLELADRFALVELSRTLVLHGKRSPKATLGEHFGSQLDLLTNSTSTTPAAWQADVILELADREVLCHSTVLRARCPFFAMMYEQEAWTVNRRAGGEGTPAGVVRVDVKHLKWAVVELALKHVYTDAGPELFDGIETATADAFIEFVVQVLAAANELLLDKLKLICSAVLRRFVTMHNVVSILADTDFYRADALREACMDYISCSLETMLESQMLQTVPTWLMKALTAFARRRQLRRSPTSRSKDRMAALMIKHADYLAELDLAPSTVGTAPRKWKPFHRSPGPSPASPGLVAPSTSLTSQTVQAMPPSAVASPAMSAVPSPTPSPALGPLSDDVPFVMDDLEEALPSSSASRRPSGQKVSPWAMVTPSKVPPLDLRSTTPSEKRPSLGPVSASRPPGDLFGRLTPDRRPSHGSPDALVAVSPPAAAGWKPSGPTTWRAAEAAKVSLAAIQQEQTTAKSTPSRPSPNPSRPSIGSPSPSLLTKSAPRSVSAQATPQRSTDPASAIGAEVITPSRGANTSGGGRSRSGPSGQDAPWVNYTSTTSSAPPPPTPPQPEPPTPTGATSFAEIQSQQSDERSKLVSRHARPSFAQIQEEETRRVEEQRNERQFLKWFEEESAKASENARPAPARGTGRQKGKGSGRKAAAEGPKDRPAPDTATADNKSGNARGRGRGRAGGGGSAGRGGGRGKGTRQAPPPTSATTGTALSSAAPAFVPRQPAA